MDSIPFYPSKLLDLGHRMGFNPILPRKIRDTLAPLALLPSPPQDYIMDDKKLGEGSFGQVCVVTQKVTGQKRAMKRVAIQTEMVAGLDTAGYKLENKHHILCRYYICIYT